MNPDAQHDSGFRRVGINRRALLRRSGAGAILGLAEVKLAIADDRDPPATATNPATPASDQSATPVTCSSPVAMASEATPISPRVTTMTNLLRFDPESITINVGQTVEWVNESSLPHTVTNDAALNPVGSSHPEYISLPDGAEPWSSELLQPGERYSRTFTVPGEYRYLCIPHVLSGMRGTIKVRC